MQPEKARGVRRCFGSVADCFDHFLLLVRAQFGGPAKPSSAIASGRQAGPGPFTDHRPLKLRETFKHLHDHAARRGCGVHRLGDTSEADVAMPFISGICTRDPENCS
jgi:hypothetical protein